MKFRFCGDLDCPDWVLAEISVLSKLSSIKFKLLSLEVTKALLGRELDTEKVQKLTTDARFEDAEIKGSVAVLTFILESAAKGTCEPTNLNAEMQQLGLPNEHAQAMTKVYEEHLPALTTALKQRCFRLPPLQVDSWTVKPGGGAAKLDVTHGDKKMSLILTRETLASLITELKVVRAKMLELESSGNVENET